jgi:hypothetical protein
MSSCPSFCSAFSVQLDIGELTISVPLLFVIKDGEQSVHIPEFDNDGKPHDETDMSKILEDAHE